MSELHRRAGEAAGPDPRDPPPEEVRVLHVAEGQSAVPRAFSADVIVFDHEPEDAELVALLGHGVASRSEPLRRGSVIHVRWWEIPMRWMVPFGFLIFGVVTAMILWLEGPTPVGIVMLCFGWGLVLPGLLAILWGLNRSLRSESDLSRIHPLDRRVEVPKSGLDVGFEEIAFMVDLRRWSPQGPSTEGGDLVRQLGVVVPDEDENGRAWSYHTLALDLDYKFGRPIRRWDELLVGFGRPIRKIRLPLREAMALGDGW